MFNRRIIVGLLASVGTVAATGMAWAKGPHKHHDGHAALGGKLKQNGKHSLGKAGTANVEATVSNGKVTAMSATDAKGGNLPAKKVKSRKKMAAMESGRIQVASNENTLQLAQVDVYYYGWGFDTGVEEVYYWYPASDVVIEDTWVEYTL
jgi:hypothetical protein